jgi:8-oxo-dGTP pyrophosphatase MutT (NUDIX family)
MTIAPSAKGVPAPWSVLEARYAIDDQWLKVRREKVRLPNGNILNPYYTIEHPDWVNVIAITGQRTVVLCEQYRHGAKQVLVELPAGAVATGEEPEIAIRRELREETGYASSHWQRIGTHMSEAARQSNRVHAFLALDAAKTAPQTLDEGEIIAVQEMPWAEFGRDLAKGEIILSASQMASLLWLQLLARNSTDDRLQSLVW